MIHEEHYERRISHVEQILAANDVRFESIYHRLDAVERKLCELTKWTQTTSITVGLGVVAALIAWIMTR
ncbi:MAG TPA: hypothetical protein EYP63_06030 [Desulfotomaculum sp.]|nr:hypothetical protein [Desulfotomaculum sp.]